MDARPGRRCASRSGWGWVCRAVLIWLLLGDFDPEVAAELVLPCTDSALCVEHHSQDALRHAWGDVYRDIQGGFLPNLRSPCWRNSSGTAHCLPGLIVAGVAKCGTTDLFRRLKLHPQLQASRVKEPHWLTRAGRIAEQRRYPLSAYLAMWDTQADEVIRKDLLTFEGSASTFWDRGTRNDRNDNVLVPEVLAKLVPNVKILAIIREPKSRLWSDFKYFTRDEALISPEEFHERCRNLTIAFQQCCMQRARIECVYNATYQRSNPRIALSMYSEYIKVWHRYFPPSRLMIISTEQMFREPRTVFESIFDFLGVDPLPAPLWRYLTDMDRQANSNTHFSNLRMLNNTRGLLDTFYAPFNSDLADLLHGSKEYATVVPGHQFQPQA